MNFNQHVIIQILSVSIIPLGIFSICFMLELGFGWTMLIGMIILVPIWWFNGTKMMDADVKESRYNRDMRIKKEMQKDLERLRIRDGSES